MAMRGSEELFLGGRYGPSAMAFYEMLAAWRASGDLEGMKAALFGK
jgi:hypothetical protein